MGILANIKAAFTTARYLAATSQTMSGIGSGPRPRPFNYDAAIREFRAWAYAAAWLNASAFASTPKRLYARQRPGMKSAYATRPVGRGTLKYLAGDGATSPGRSVCAKVAEFGGDVVEVVEPHPVLTVLKTVNGFQNGFELELYRMLDLQITGNSYLHPIIGPLGVPDQIWRMPPQNVKVVPSATTFIGGYAYGGSGREQPFAIDEVIHFKLPNPADLFYGMGWYEAGWKSLGLHDSKRDLDLSTFDNYARPDWLLTVPGGNTPAMDSLEKKLTEKFRGVAGRDRSSFITLSQDVKAQALNWQTPEVGTPTRVIEEISAVSGVPVAMLLSNNPNRASSESARLGWYRNTIQPYCRLDEEKLNEQWVPLFDGAGDLFLAHDPANFEDLNAQSTRMVGLVAGGVLTPNEARAEINYPAHVDGDDLYAPTGATGGGSVNPDAGGAGAGGSGDGGSNGGDAGKQGEDDGQGDD